MTDEHLRGRKLADLFFTQDRADDKTWVCICGKSIKQKGSGYTNLCNHINSQHPEALQHAKQGFTRESLVALLTDTVSWSEETRAVMGWMRMVIKCLLPVEICELPAFQRISKFQPVSSERVSTSMKKVAKVVEEKVRREIKDKSVCLIIDALRLDNAEWISLFASFLSSDEGVVKTVLLKFQPEIVEHQHSSEDVAKFVGCALSTYEVSPRNVVALVGKKFLYAEYLCQRFGWNYISCWSNRFSTAVDMVMSDVLGEAGREIDVVVEKMMQVPERRLSAKLRTTWDRRTTSSVNIPWRGIMSILQEYVSIVERRDQEYHATWLGAHDGSHMVAIRTCVTALIQIEEAHRAIEHSKTSIGKSSAIFQEHLSRFPRLRGRMTDMPLFDETVFETGVQKVELNRILAMSAMERDATKCLLPTGFGSTSESSSSSNQDADSYEFQAQKRMKLSYVPSKNDFKHVCILRSSSNLLSKIIFPSDPSLSERCNIFELSDEQIFLLANESFWGILDVDKELRSERA